MVNKTHVYIEESKKDRELRVNINHRLNIKRIK
jgi:hypothetical protein